jgi:hypothetical protein
MESIIIANCGGFWGDDPTAAKRQVEGGPIDYLVMDYLAEVTMAILHKQMARDPEKGYAADFVQQAADVLVDAVDKGIKIISNAGGVNPLAARDAVENLAADLGVADKVRVGVVLGDDLYPDLDALIESGEELRNLDNGSHVDEIKDRILSANVYLGAAPVVKALEMGANIVITGRVTDTGVTLAPMIHEFGWAGDDWDRIASGIVAGHIIECGLQATGGNFTDWEKVPSWSNMGYPIIEAREDGTFTVTKHDGTGGLVSEHTVTEQLLYEMGAPSYLSPDVTAWFDSIQLAAVGQDRVEVTGVVGAAPPETWKVSVSYRDGYRSAGKLLISGPNTLKKARHVEQVFWESIGGRETYADSISQIIGWDGTHPPLDPESEPSEVLLPLAVRDADADKIRDGFAAQLVPKVLGTIPGITYLSDTGRPRPMEVIAYWPALISREAVTVDVIVGDQSVTVAPDAWDVEPSTFEPTGVAANVTETGNPKVVALSELCLGRSGDKGDTANIGIIGRSPEIYSWMLESLTSEFVANRFGGVAKGTIDRFEVPNLLSLNFLLHGSLGGGGTGSLQVDPQGKTYAQYLLATEVTVDEALVTSIVSD